MLHLPSRKVRSAVAKDLVRIGACQVDVVRGFPYTSGGRGPLYCNLRDVQGDVVLRNLVFGHMQEIVGQQYPECDILAGIKTGAIPLSASLADRLRLPHTSINKEPKAATGELLEGAKVKGRRCVVVEDTINKGGALVRGVNAAREAGGLVVGCLSVLVYREKVACDMGVDLYALTTVPDILAALMEARKISGDDRMLVEAWLSDQSSWRPREV